LFGAKGVYIHLHQNKDQQRQTGERQPWRHVPSARQFKQYGFDCSPLLKPPAFGIPGRSAWDATVSHFDSLKQIDVDGFFLDMRD